MTLTGSVLEIHGDVDYHNFREVGRQAIALLDTHGEVTLDLIWLQFMDSSGLSTIFMAVKHAMKLGLEPSQVVHIRHAPGRIARNIKRTGLYKLVDLQS